LRTALQQRASAKLCGVVGLQGMELRNFRRKRHLFGWAGISLGIGPHYSLIFENGGRGNLDFFKIKIITVDRVGNP